jgi:hypothetical protein
MAYQINLTDGTPFATIADGTINTQSSMILVGKNYAGYGEFLDGNFIHLLENGASVTAPGNPLTGQLWWDKSSNLLKVYNGSTFKTISAATASSTAPTNNVLGDLWYDSVNQQLNVYNGSAFILVGPQSSAGTGTTGAIPAQVTDTPGGITHTIIKLTVADTVVGTVSQDAEFTPSGAGIPGFTTIKPGITLATTVGSQTPLFQGTAANAVLLNGVTSSGFVRNSGTGQTMSVSLGVLNNTGLTVGSNSDFKASVAGTVVTLQNQTQDGNINFSVNDGGVTTVVMTLDGANGTVNFGNTSPVFTGISVASITKSGTNAVGNIGSSSSYFNRVFATATTALYADVAERFAADTEYAPGTVVELGGIKEITKSLNELSDNVFGVISTRAAFLMNGGAGEDDTHPPVAMTGRVPVRCVGLVNKGDRLVSAGNGLARAALLGEATAFNTIGRALVSKVESTEGMVEAIVTIK